MYFMPLHPFNVSEQVLKLLSKQLNVSLFCISRFIIFIAEIDHKDH